jgi:FAD/FMN-containing dehydrogenase
MGAIYMKTFLDLCIKAIGAEHVILDELDQASYLVDWRNRKRGQALAILRPGSTLEVATLVKICSTYSVNIVPQGGNTGLVLGGIPEVNGSAVVISLKRLNKIRDIDVRNNTITVEAGCLLENVQISAGNSQRLFPLSLASQGSCTIGGNLATNAGGTGVLRYGNMRELCLGLEVVNAKGEVWNGLRALRKDNTGYDLRDLFIGSEGTLGIITAAVLKLYSKPNSQLTAFVALNSMIDAINFLLLIQKRSGAELTGFELMNQFSLDLVHKHFPTFQQVFSVAHPYYALIELSSGETELNLKDRLESSLEVANTSGLIEDAVVCFSESQTANCWQIRESISAAQAKEGRNIKHDISLPISKIADFIFETNHALQERFPGCQMVTFGHLGDGNLHYNISPPEGEVDSDFLQNQVIINQIVHDKTHFFHGSISAEHGIGTLKKQELLRYKSTIELDMMRGIKTALDPENIMNPGKIFETIQ